MSTVARSLKGTLIGGLSFVTHLLQAVAVVPLMLQGWGPSQYAMWIACQAAFGLILTLDLGHQTYVGNELTKTLPVDREAARSVLGSALRFAWLLGAAEVGCVGLLMAFGQLDTVLGVDDAALRAHRLAEILLWLVASWVIFGSLGGVLARLYGAVGQYVRGAVWGLVQKLLVVSVVAAAAFWQRTLLGTAQLASLVSLLFSAAFLWDCRRTLPELSPFFARGSLRAGARNFGRSLPVTGANLLVQLQTNGLLLLVSALFGPASLAAFATLRTLANTIVQAAGAIFSPAVPELVRLRVTDQYQKLRVGLFGLALVAGLPVSCGALLLAAVGEPLYELWTGGKIPFDRSLFHVLAAAAVWRIFGYPLVNHLLAMNQTRSIGGWALAQTATLFALAGVLTPLVGLPGIALAVLGSELVGSVALPLSWMHAELPEPERRAFLREQLLGAATPALVSVALAASIGAAERYRWLCALGGVAGCLALFARQYRQIPPDLRSQARRAFWQLLGRDIEHV